MLNINPSQEIFALFYAITWGSLANVWPRWRAFDWAGIARKTEHRITIQRCLFSLVVLNAFPILFFILVLRQLEHWTLDGGWWSIGTKLTVVMIQPFALIGFYWLWVAMVQYFRTAFYPAALTKQHYFSLVEEHDLDRSAATPNLIFGLVYVLGPIVALLSIG